MQDLPNAEDDVTKRTSEVVSNETTVRDKEPKCLIQNSESFEKSKCETEEVNRLNKINRTSNNEECLNNFNSIKVREICEKSNPEGSESQSDQCTSSCSSCRTSSVELNNADRERNVRFDKSLDIETDHLLDEDDAKNVTFQIKPRSNCTALNRFNKLFIAPAFSRNKNVSDHAPSLDDEELNFSICSDEGKRKAVSFQDSSLWKKYSYKDFKETTLRMSNLPARSPIDIEFKELTCYVPVCGKKELKTILKGVGGSFQHGKLTAIVGPSGAGKTTLMNILSGYRISNVTGSISVNNKERNLKSFRKRSCFIMQDSHLLPYLSVIEYLEGAAILKLGDHRTEDDKNKVIEEIIQTLGISQCRNTRVLNLSGGEKKRLSIALELVNNPPVMFFDEPTSGLDSSHSFQCMQLLKSLAEGGRTIVCTIHQPSARLYETFDTLYALAEGHCIYRGKAKGVVPFLGSLGLDCPTFHNPVDFLVEVASGEYGSFIEQLSSKVSGGQWSRNMANSQSLDIVKTNDHLEDSIASEEGLYNQKRNVETSPTMQPLLMSSALTTQVDYPASFQTQFRVLFWRSLISITRDTFLTKLRVFVHIIVGIFIGLLYYQIGNDAHEVRSNIGFLFFGVLFFTFTSMIPTTLTFPLEMNVFIREHLNHWYGLKPYYLAKTMADVPFQIAFAVLYVVISYFMTSQPVEAERFLLLLFFSIMISLVAQSIGLSIGAAANAQQAVFLGPALAIPPLLFCGFLVSFSAIPSYFRWISYISYIRYAFEGILISMYGLNRPNLECSEAFCFMKNSSKVLESMDIKESMLVIDAVLILVYFIAVRVLGYFILRWKLKKER